jgi:hypothetical protein
MANRQRESATAYQRSALKFHFIKFKLSFHSRGCLRLLQPNLTVAHIPELNLT